MPRKVFFSFHFQRDSFRVNQVRNSTLMQPAGYTAPHFYDKAEFEKIKRTTGIKPWIDNQLFGTSVTVVLIGNETSARPWVQYEIAQSWNKSPRNGLLGVYIHNCKCPRTGSDLQGNNPFTDFLITPLGIAKHSSIASGTEWYNALVGSSSYRRLSSIIQTYDWIYDNGRQNIGSWIETAARQAGR